MKVSCPKCNRSYNVDDHRIPDDGLTMRCPKCQAVLKVSKKKKETIAYKTSKPLTDNHKPPAEPSFATGEPPTDVGPSRLPLKTLARPPVSSTFDNKGGLAGNEEFNLPMKTPGESFEEVHLASIPASLKSPETFPLKIPVPVREKVVLPKPSPMPLGKDGERDTFDLPELSSSIDLLTLGADDLPPSFEPPSLDSLPPPHQEAMYLDAMPSTQGSGDFGDIDLSIPDDTRHAFVDGKEDERLDLSVSLDGTTPEEESDNGAFDFSRSMDSLAPGGEPEDEPYGSKAPERVSAAAGRTLSYASVGDAFGDIDLPLSDRSDGSDDKEMDLPSALKRDSDRAWVPPTSSLRDHRVTSTVSDLLKKGPPMDGAMEDIPSPADLLDHAPSGSPTSSPQRMVRVESSGSTSFGEVSLSPEMGTSAETEALEVATDEGEFADFPTSTTDPNASASAKGGELDLAADPMALRQEGAFGETSELEGEEDRKPGDHREATQAFEGRRRWERQTRRTKLVLLGSLMTLLAVGVGMSYTPLGPFGSHFLYTLIPRTTNKGVVQQAVKSASFYLKKDTFYSLKIAVDEAVKSADEYPRSEDLRLLVVYLCYWYQVRFGEDKNLDRLATKYLGATNLNESELPRAQMVKLAQYFRFSRQIKVVGPLRESLKETDDGLATLAEAYLVVEDVKNALEMARRLDEKERSPRSGYLLARALLQQRAEKGRSEAIGRLSKLVAEHGDHVDAMLLLANTLISRKPLDVEKARGLTRTVLGEKVKESLPRQQAEAHAILARIFVSQRSYLEAESEVILAEKLYPDNVSMLISKGRIALYKKDYPVAGAAFNSALANAPKDIGAILGKIETDIREGELAAAKQMLVSVIPEHQSNAVAHYLMGEVQFALKDTKAAETELKRAIELDNELLEAYVSLSTLYLSSNRNPDAMAILDRASEAVPKSPLIKKTLAVGHMARGDFSSAIVELDNALKLDPDDIEAHFLMAQMYRRMGSFDDAKRALDEVEKRHPSYPGLALEQGLVMEASGDVAKALSSYKKALSVNPDDANLKLRVAAAAHILGDRDTAENLLKEVLEKTPNSAEANFYMGEALRTSGRIAESLTLLQRACELDKEKALYRLRYGMALMAVGDTDRALDALQVALQQDEKLAETYIRLAQIRLKQGSVRFAIDLAQKGLALDDSFGDGYMTIAEAFEELAEIPKAVDFYLKAQKIMPENAELNFKLGLVELSDRGSRVALESFAKAVRLAEKGGDPKPPWLPESLYRLGEAQRSVGQRGAAITSFKRYLEIAPEDAIDRAQVRANLIDLGVAAE